MKLGNACELTIPSGSEGYTDCVRPIPQCANAEKLVTDPKKYTPLSERLQQDVWHDNFVPKYSELGTSKPSTVIIVGVWLVFVPMAFLALAIGLDMASDAPDIATAVVSVIAPGLYLILAVAVLFSQTRRFRNSLKEKSGQR